MENREDRIRELESELDIHREGKCVQYFCSREQQLSELKSGLGLEGTQGYENMGCFGCKGYEVNCEAFYIYNGKKNG